MDESNWLLEIRCPDVSGLGNLHQETQSASYSKCSQKLKMYLLLQPPFFLSRQINQFLYISVENYFLLTFCQFIFFHFVIKIKCLSGSQ